MAHISPFQGELDRGLARQKMTQNLDTAWKLLTMAGNAGCDLACYPEDLQGIAHYGYYLDDIELMTGFVETVPGPTTDFIAKIAARHSMNIVFGIFERDGDKIYNSAVLLDRKGKVAGKYHKVHLPMSEKWTTTSGDAFPVFKTDFGTVGILICYDIVFPESSRCLALNGAEILCNPTMGFTLPGQSEDNGLVRVRMRAMDNFLPFVLSICGSGSIIVDRDGRIRAQARQGVEEVITATIDLDATPTDRSQWEVITGTADVRARLLQERMPKAYQLLATEEPPVLESFRNKRIRTTQQEYREAYEKIRKMWSRSRRAGCPGTAGPC